MLIPFPVTFLVTTLVADLAKRGTGNVMWATATLWPVGAGVVIALIAAVAGFIDSLGVSRTRDLSDAWLHFLGNLQAVVISAFNRYPHARVPEAATP